MPISAEVASVLLVVGLFMLGVASPGPNFVVVVERSMASGFRAGFVTGLGVAAGDALYAAAGLLGLAAVVVQAGWLFGVVKVLGGLYIAWIGLRMVLRSRRPSAARSPAEGGEPGLATCFRAGLLTDLSNPKTVVFFASIFATAYDPALPAWVAGAMWAGIVGSSILWRAGVAAAFSRNAVRAVYGRFRGAIEVVFGLALVAFGLRLTLQPRAPR